MRKVTHLFIASCCILLSGCTGLNIERTRLASGAFIHIPIVSADEDRLLREATERAVLLHSQLRAFDVSNNAIENRISQLKNESVKPIGANRSSKAKSLRDSDTILFDTHAVQFARGVVLLDSKAATGLSTALSGGKFSLDGKHGNQKPFLVLQVATHNKAGLDSLTALRLKDIHEVIKAHNIPTEQVKLKIIRIASPTGQQKTEGSASRTIRLSTVRVGKLQS